VDLVVADSEEGSAAEGLAVEGSAEGGLAVVESKPTGIH
jgi:hypothetical protein